MTPDPSGSPTGPQTDQDPAAIAASLEQDKTKEQLEREAKARGVTPPSGSGSGGAVVKSDLAEAIAEDEVAPEDTSGRPPLVEVAEAAASNVVERVLTDAAEEE